MELEDINAMIVINGLAKNSKVLLNGDKVSQKDKEVMVKDATIAARTAAVVSLILG